MAWLRVDDGFTKHPKFEGWTPAQRWAWLETMEYCARYRTGGRIPTDLSLLPRSVTLGFLTRAEKAGWCSVGVDGALWINDWEAFNPPRGDEVDEAVRTALEATPEASANDLYRRIGGNRNQVLAAIRRYQTGTESVSESGINDSVSVLVSRAPARAFPSRPVLEPEPRAVAVNAANGHEPDAPLTEQERTALEFIDTITPDLEEVAE